MPRLLKGETIQRLNASQRSLNSALSLLGQPRPVEWNASPGDSATEVGLVGVAAELALAACLSQILGTGSLVREGDGKFLTAAEALAKFRKLLGSKIPMLEALTRGVPAAGEHLAALDKAAMRFAPLFPARAGALHAGKDVARDVAFVAAADVTSFLNLLAKSSKWKPYLREIPQAPTLPKERVVLADELARKAIGSNGTGSVAALCSLFLVLPELPECEPEWVAALERALVAPSQGDISILLKSLKAAHVGELMKVGKGIAGIPTTITKDTPGAIPISLQSVKRSFESTLEQWNAHIATANGGMGKNILDLPHIQWVYHYFSLGLQAIGIPEDELTLGLSAHAAWPFVAAALMYAGTKGPCFFVVRRTRSSEIGQLCAQLGRAGSIRPAITASLVKYEPLFRRMGVGSGDDGETTLGTQLSEEFQRREDRRERLFEEITSRRDSSTGAMRTAYQTVFARLEEEDSPGRVMTAILDGAVDLGDERTSALRILIDCCIERDDLSPLVRVLQDPKLSQLHTGVRKSLRALDFALYGHGAVA